ncbi:FMN-linked oxidoreductase [Trichoderma asperelloides]|nr:FMN-linked oxidoreductase [Trichoderma asperelloides]
MDTPAADTVPFRPLKIGNGIISSRVIMAPMARLRNCRLHVPLVPMMAIISPRSCDYPHPPGIRRNAQAAAWKAVTAAVHAQGSQIYLQIGTLGRVTHHLVLEEDVALFGLPKDSMLFVAPSLIPCSKDYPIPVELTTEEIKALIKNFATAVRHAVNDANFDGMEVHGGYGFLIDQFIQDTANQRTDSNGGNVENRSYVPQFIHLIQQLRNLKLSYLHLVEPYAARYTNTIARHGDSNDILIRMWGKTSPVSLNHGFDAISACKAIEKYIGILDIAVAMSAPFMSNPDLIYRIKRESPLCLQIGPSRTQLWTQIGIMYPFSDEWRAEQEARRRGTRNSRILIYRVKVKAGTPPV